MRRTQGFEVAYDEVPYRGSWIRIRTRLQPVWLGQDDPLFLTSVASDPDLGYLDYGKASEQEALAFHCAVVDRYRVLDHARCCDGIPEQLLEGVL
jgi:hypothetical protein